MADSTGKEIASELQRFRPYLEYKDSGVDWLGKIPADWEVKRLKYVATVSDERSYDFDSDLPYLGLEHIESGTGKLLQSVEYHRDSSEEIESAASTFRSGDVLFGKLRPYLAKVLKPDFEGRCSTELIVLRSGSDIDPPYLSYQLLSPGFIRWINSMTYGTKMPRANALQIESTRLALPSRLEQIKIAAFLDHETTKIDALIGKKERLIELLQEKRTALITQAVTKGLDPNVPMKDSGVEWLGEVPAHWEVLRLKYLLKARRGAIKTGPFGSQLQSSEMIAGEIKVYNQRSVLDHDFSAGENYISLHKFSELRSFEAFPGDLMITTRGTIGKCAVLPAKSERGILHPCLMRVQVDQAHALNRYLEILIQDSGMVLKQLQLMSNATTIDVIYSDSFKEVWNTIPPMCEQCEIADVLDRETAKIDMLIAKIQEAIDHLKEYRTALISAAVTGKIDVRKEGM
jgi:type I restriction enzyme S subunit